MSIEYALIRDINDQEERADLLGRELARRGKGWVHVNPIPLNPTPGSKWTASDPRVQDAFVERLRSHGVPVDRAGHPRPRDRRRLRPARRDHLTPRRPPSLIMQSALIMRSEVTIGARPHSVAAASPLVP